MKFRGVSALCKWEAESSYNIQDKAEGMHTLASDF